MCGITGFLDFTRSSTDEVLRAEVQARIKAGMAPFMGRVSHIVFEDLAP